MAFSVNGSCGFNTAILTGDGGPIETVVDICTNPGPTAVHRPSISNTGAVAFGLASGNSFDFVIRAKNGAFVTIAGPGASPAGIGPLSMAYEPSINNNDVVTFMGNREDTGAGVLFTGAGGKVAFPASLPSGATGVFTGPVPVADKVLQTDDPLYDSLGVHLGTVTGVTILREAINDSGQVAMAVAFNDIGTPRVAIIRADPPNAPPVASDDSLSVAPGGSVSDTLGASDPDAANHLLHRD